MGAPLSRELWAFPVLVPLFRLSMRQQWFTHVRLLVAYLTRSRRAFSATLTTPALDRRSLRWFGLPACTANPEGQTSITGAARFMLATFYVTLILLSGHTPYRRLPTTRSTPISFACATTQNPETYYSSRREPRSATRQRLTGFFCAVVVGNVKPPPGQVVEGSV